MNKEPSVGHAQKAEFTTLRNMGVLCDVHGPDRPFASLLGAAAQLHRTGNSSIAQHFRRGKVGRAGQTGPWDHCVVKCRTRSI